MSKSDLRSMIEEGERLRRSNPAMAAFHLVLPCAVLIGVIAVLIVSGAAARVGAAAVTAFFFLGKLIILNGGIDNPFEMTTLQFAVMVFFLDLWVAYTVGYNLHHIYRIPRLGPWLERLQNYCRFWIVRNPWMKRWAFTGVALFVLFPLTGTGAPGGTILGRLVGLRPRTTLIGIAVGSALGCGMMAAFAEQLRPYFERVQGEWWFKALGVVILGILLLLLYRLGQRISRASDEYARSDAAGGDA